MPQCLQGYYCIHFKCHAHICTFKTSNQYYSFFNLHPCTHSSCISNTYAHPNSHLNIKLYSFSSFTLSYNVHTTAILHTHATGFLHCFFGWTCISVILNLQACLNTRSHFTVELFGFDSYLTYKRINQHFRFTRTHLSTHKKIINTLSELHVQLIITSLKHQLGSTWSFYIFNRTADKCTQATRKTNQSLVQYLTNPNSWGSLKISLSLCLVSFCLCE